MTLDCFVLLLSGFECDIVTFVRQQSNIPKSVITSNVVDSKHCLVVMAERPHLFPCRTQSLSSPAPMVVGHSSRQSRTLPGKYEDLIIAIRSFFYGLFLVYDIIFMILSLKSDLLVIIDIPLSVWVTLWKVKLDY